MSAGDDWPSIVALSTASGRAGVAVLRLSGAKSRFALETIAGAVPPPRLATLRALRAPDGELVDRGLVLFFPGPASFSGEDVAEFHVHGSVAVVARLLGVLTSLPGIRLAEPGEFTRRAFEAGKLDLTAVEGLADLIDSETEWQRRQALRQLDGALGRATAGWREALVEAMSRIEADLDFSDEGDVSGPLLSEARAQAAIVLAGLREALSGLSAGERVREGFMVVLCGPPNAGKSSLLNALARRDVAIVSAVPGTTRDAIEVRLDLGGMPVTLIDTAGLRDSDDPVEREGVRRARARAEQADLVLLLEEIDSVPDRFDGDPRFLAVTTKVDRGGARPPGGLGVSVVTGEGIAALIEAIAGRLAPGGAGEPALITRERHRIAITAAAEALERVVSGGVDAAELVAEDLRLAVRALDRLIGRVDVEDVLDRLFSRFCIGK